MKRIILSFVFTVLVSSQAFAVDNLSAAFKACLNQNVLGSSVNTSKIAVAKSGNYLESTEETILVINCDEAPAKSLFVEVKRFAVETQEKFIAEGYEIVLTTRYFGNPESNLQSQCKEFNVANGGAYFYNCGILFDLNSSLVKALNL